MPKVETKEIDPLQLAKIEAEQEMMSCISRLKVEEQAIRDYIQIKTFKKGSYLIREGQVTNKCYFVIKGCVRQYYLKNGEEKTTFFYTDDQSIFSLGSPSRTQPSSHYLCCVEDSVLSVMTVEDEREMYDRFPRLQAMSRISLQEELANYHEMLATYITTSPEERYTNLLKNRPELLKKVPQYQLASYLGITPESLSRIRKRISSL